GVVVSGFYGEGIGTFFNLDRDSIDGTGDERVTWGGYAQATFDAGGGTNVGVSYGGTYYGKQTQYDSRNHSSHVTIKARELLSAMVWHNINDNLRLVAEYGHVEDEWNDGQSRESDAVSVGGFFFW
ncbi:MAG: porin, partial [Rickettsiales bacterium]|nr:porin [Rickettsiales bacterium]